MTTRIRRAAGTVLATVLAAMLVLSPVRADAHSLERTTVSMNLASSTPEVTLTLPLPALAEALGTSADDLDTDAAIAYIAEHLEVTSAEGSVWAESFHDATVTSVEGIPSFTVKVDLDANGTSLDDFTLAYDAIVETVSGQEAVVVLTDSTGNISTAGVISEAEGVVTVGDGSAGSGGLLDMVHHGITHVLAGADHLLFLLVLLLPAALVVRSGRWQPGRTPRQTIKQVLGVVTAFTVGHSITLVSAGFALITVPSRPVEVLIALSVAVGAAHALKPLVRRGEQVIAGCFGLIHGLAFAAILTNLNLQKTATVGPLLAFNIGVELAQLLVVALIFPSLYLIGRTRFERPARLLGGGIPLLASAAWILDRTGLLSNPFAVVENALVGHPWWVVGATGSLATLLGAVDRRTRHQYPATTRGEDSVETGFRATVPDVRHH